MKKSIISGNDNHYSGSKHHGGFNSKNNSTKPTNSGITSAVGSSNGSGSGSGRGSCSLMILVSCWPTWSLITKTGALSLFLLLIIRITTTTITSRPPSTMMFSSILNKKNDDQKQLHKQQQQQEHVPLVVDIEMKINTNDSASDAVSRHHVLRATTMTNSSSSTTTTTTTPKDPSSGSGTISDGDNYIESQQLVVDTLTKDEYVHARDSLLHELQESSHEDNEKLRKYIARIDVPIQWLPKVADAIMNPCPHELVEGTQAGRSNKNNTTIIYSPSYGDRSGAVVQHMLMAYAYSYQHGFQYGGSIIRAHDVGFQRKRVVHEKLIRSMGLQNTLKFVIPPSDPSNNADDANVYFVRVETCLESYETGMTSFSPTFVKHLQKQVAVPADVGHPPPPPQEQQQQHQQNRQKKVAVHIRRGDAQPCTEDKFRKRYRANAYYLKILDAYADGDANVTIYSQGDSFETFDEFHKRGYSVELDGSVVDAWTGMITADLFIMSPYSDFSSVPAILNPNMVIFTHEINHWIAVSKSIQDESEIILQQLVNKRCRIWLDENPFHREKFTDW